MNVRMQDKRRELIAHMKIISCHIENFGKLSDYDFHFEEGCNVICQRNGWGKSTLMAFLRVMLYGFANESKRSELENERKRYKPWQGGVYGGNLTFEAGGKRYRCYRVFGDKEKDDQFRLLEDATNLETHDFSEKLGEELFQIDQDSFLKSACIGQMKSDVRFVEATGSMSAKLGDLMEETGDISQFEAVDKKLTDLLNQMSPRRATGSLYKQKKELEEYSFQITKKGKIEQTIADIRKKRQEEAELKERLGAERDQVNEKQKQLVLQEKRKRYQALLAERDQKQEEYESQRKQLPKELPEENELERKIKTAAEMEENHSAMEIYVLSVEEEQKLKAYEDKFSIRQWGSYLPDHDVSGSSPSECRPPEREEIDQIRGAIQKWRNNQGKLNELRVPDEDCRKLAAYRSRFADALPKEEELERLIRSWEKRNQKKEALATKKASLNMAKMMAQQAKEAAFREAAAARAEEEAAARKSGNAGGMILLVMGLFMVLAGILLFITYHRGIGIAGMVLGVMIAGLAAVYGMRKKEQKKAKAVSHKTGASSLIDGKDNFDNMDEEALSGEDEAVLSLEQEIREDDDFIHKTEAEVRCYLEIHKMEWEEYRISDELHQLKNAVCEYHGILAREERYRQQERECRNDELRRQIEEFLGRYDTTEVIATGEYGELLQRLIGDVENYQKLKEKRDHYTRRIRVYEQQREELHSFMEQMSLEPEDDLYEQLLELQKHLRICIEKHQQLQSAERALEEYKDNEDSKVFLNEPGEEVSETAEQLYERQNEISRQMERVQSNIHAYHIQLEENEEKIEQINEQELLFEELKEIYEADLKKYDHLVKTQKYLKIAKERLTEKYMAPLLNGFRKYYGILTGEEAGSYRLDANAHLTIEEQGFPRLPELLSTGYRDIAGLCMRMALIDAMYQSDAPFILMDDPFVNYDEQNLRGGMDFLKKASESYQIVYFTCRRSTPY